MSDKEAINLVSGRGLVFRLDWSFGRPIPPLSGEFFYKTDFAAAIEEFNRLVASRAHPGERPSAG